MGQVPLPCEQRVLDERGPPYMHLCLTETLNSEFTVLLGFVFSVLGIESKDAVSLSYTLSLFILGDSFLPSCPGQP